MLRTHHQNAQLELALSGGGNPSLAEIISALSFALDLTEGAVPGHALRSCVIGMRLGLELRLTDVELADLFHALLLKDVGCSSNAARMCQIIGGDDRAAKAGAKFEDWTRPHQPTLSAVRLLWRNVLPAGGPMSRAARILHIGLTQHSNNKEMIQLRCDRGASIVRKIGMSNETAEAVHSLDEHWDGSGYPERLRGTAISPLARVMAVAQHLDVFAQERGPEQAMLVLRVRSGRWFDPETVKAAESLHKRGTLWQQCLPDGERSSAETELSTRAAAIDLSPGETGRIGAARIDLICEAFAEVVDAKSPFTFQHSLGVTDAASMISIAMGLKQEKRQLVYRAALLHDLGKLRVPNSILDKPGKLDDAEWSIMQEHPGLTRAILGRVKQFHEMADVAGAHHEKLDGTGYPDRLCAKDLSLEARIVAIADMYGALTEDRPYRRGYSAGEALKMMERDVPDKLDADCFEALYSVAETGREAAFLKPTGVVLQDPFAAAPTATTLDQLSLT
jgi:HD-GYP domain-containing protein (c-di-GMP phosphodiesterase class II)